MLCFSPSNHLTLAHSLVCDSSLALSISPSRQKIRTFKIRVRINVWKIDFFSYSIHAWTEYMYLSHRNFLPSGLSRSTREYESKKERKKMHCCAQNVLNSCGKWKQYHTVKWTSENTTWNTSHSFITYSLCNTNKTVFFRVSRWFCRRRWSLSLFYTIYGLARIHRSDHPMQWFAWHPNSFIEWTSSRMDAIVNEA